MRPSRVFNIHKPLEDTSAQELQELRAARAERMAKIREITDELPKADPVKIAQRKKEEARLAEEKWVGEIGFTLFLNYITLPQITCALYFLSD